MNDTSAFLQNLTAASPTPLDLAGAAERRQRASIVREVEAGATSAAKSRESLAALANRPTAEAESSSDPTETAPEDRAAAAETRAARREIALEYQLSRDDAELLDACANDDAARRIAARLAGITARPTYRR